MIRQDLYLPSPWMNAAGMLGFAPPARWPVNEPMGAFVTNPISLAPRTPAAERGLQSYPGGALLHSGLPNPGLSRVIHRYAVRWEQSSLPVWAHLIGSNPAEIHQMVQRLEGREGIMAIELGLPPEARGNEALAFVEAAFGEIPLVVHLPLTAAGEPWLNDLPGLGASAISLGAPRGALRRQGGPLQEQTGAQSKNGSLLSGRLYGPSLFPLMMAAVQAARRIGIPLIAGAGIYRRQDAQALRDAGAWAVQLDTVLWRGWVE
jgi:dihydroorotate dehydrogenase (NAD+) catalytic subunit